MERITSRQNESIRQHAKLLQSPSKRREERRFLCEGARLCLDAVRSGVSIEVCYVTEKAMEKYPDYCGTVIQCAQRSYQIVDQVAPLLSDTKNPQGIFCVCKMPESTLRDIDMPLRGHYLALEDMQDPANLGTVLRTAEALGVNGILLTKQCCDVFSPKVLRGSMGAVFRLPLFFCESMEQAVDRLNERGFSTLASVVSEDAVPVSLVDFTRPTVMLIGNEGNGLTEETTKVCALPVTIPMAGRAESLNASAAAAILLWEMMRGGAAHG